MENQTTNCGQSQHDRDDCIWRNTKEWNDWHHLVSEVTGVRFVPTQAVKCESTLSLRLVHQMSCKVHFFESLFFKVFWNISGRMRWQERKGARLSHATKWWHLFSIAWILSQRLKNVSCCIHVGNSNKTKQWIILCNHVIDPCLWHLQLMSDTWSHKWTTCLRTQIRLFSCGQTFVWLGSRATSIMAQNEWVACRLNWIPKFKNLVVRHVANCLQLSIRQGLNQSFDICVHLQQSQGFTNINQCQQIAVLWQVSCNQMAMQQMRWWQPTCSCFCWCGMTERVASSPLMHRCIVEQHHDSFLELPLEVILHDGICSYLKQLAS